MRSLVNFKHGVDCQTSIDGASKSARYYQMTMLTVLRYRGISRSRERRLLLQGVARRPPMA